MSINVAAVVAQFGAFYKPGSDNEKNLSNSIYQGGQLANFFQLRPTDDTVWRGNRASLDRVVQPFQKAFTAIGTTTFEPNTFDLFKMKIDLSETPDDLEATYLGFLTSVPTIERANWPFVRWFLENHVMPKKIEDLELNEYVNGVYVAPTANVAGAAGTAMNGLRKVISDYNTASKTNLGNGAISTGAIAASDDDVCSQIEEFVEDIPSLYRSRLDFLFMSETNARKYRRGKRKKYGLNVNYLQGTGVNDLNTIEDQPNISVVGSIAMEGLDLMFATTAANRIRPVKRLNDTFQIESETRTVKIFNDWWEALNFEVPQYIFHNELDLL